jgi:hypothetical protein
MRIFFLVILCLTLSKGFSQKQLVLLKGQRVKLRLYPGDDIVFKLRGVEGKRSSYINNLFDTAVMAHRTNIPLHKIERLYFSQGNFMNVVGGLLVVGGVGYFLIDQVNLVLVNKESFEVEEKVAIPAAIMVGVGLPMMLVRKKSQRVGGRYRLLVVDGSPFYVPQRQSGSSIFIREN